MTETTELAVIPPKDTALAVYSAPNGLDPYLAHVRAEIDSFVPDVTTKKGRDAIASIAYKVAKSKTALDNMGKELVAELKDVPRKIDAERKRMRDLLDAWKDEVRKPLTDFEAAEEARIAKHKLQIELIQSSAQVEMDFSSSTIRSKIAALELFVVDESMQEFEAEAHRIKQASLASLNTALVQREAYEAEQAELAKLRAEAEARAQKDREEQIAREAAEKAKKDAEEKAERERQELAAKVEREKLEAQAAIDRAERQKVEAEAVALKAKHDAEEAAKRAAEKAEADKQAAIEAERQAQARKIAQEKAEAEQREKNKAHAKKINNEILADIVAAGCSEECGKSIISAIARGKVRHTQINY